VLQGWDTCAASVPHICCPVPRPYSIAVPAAKVHLAQTREDVEGDGFRCGESDSRLLRSLQIAGIDGFDGLALELLGQCRNLVPAALVE
jgi:hypothetical protein